MLVDEVYEKNEHQGSEISNLKTIVLVAGIILIMILSSSLYFLKKILHPLEIFTYLMIYIILQQQTFTIITINIHALKASSDIFSIFPVKIAGMFLYPICGLWVFSAFFLKYRSIARKIAALVLFLVMTSVNYEIQMKLQYIQKINWPYLYELLRSVSILFATFFFSVVFRKYLRKGGMIS